MDSVLVLSLSSHYSIEINMFELMHKDNILGVMLLRYPTMLLGVLEDAIYKAQELLVENLRCDPIAQFMTVKGRRHSRDKESHTRVHPRLVHLPPHSSCCKPSLSSINAEDMGRIVQLTGTVVRASPVRMYESSRTYACVTKGGCKGTFSVAADLMQSNNSLPTPTCCPGILPDNYVNDVNLADNASRGGGGRGSVGRGRGGVGGVGGIKANKPGDKCRGTVIEVINSLHTDYQELKIQESATKVGVGSIPRSLLVKMEDDLVDTCKPGDDVVIVGSLMPQWQPVSANIQVDIGVALRAHSIRVLNAENDDAGTSWDETLPINSTAREKLRREFHELWEVADKDNDTAKYRSIASRNFIVQSVCPKLYGLMTIKLALLLTLIGGVSDVQTNATDETELFIASIADTSHQDLPLSEVEDRVPRQFSLFADSDDDEEITSSKGKADLGIDQNNQQASLVKTRRREQSHLLLVGDPGTGKSQLLRFAAALSPRSVLTTGVGTTSAGLTCAAVREGSSGSKEFMLEAGALVLADRGVCCIDEFGCINNDDRTTIHEAMEQQTLSVAKAGIICKLNCRTTIIAATNPKGNLYQIEKSLMENTGIGSPLLSRFDLIFKMVDSSDFDRDDRIASHLLNDAIRGSAGFQTLPESSGDGSTKRRRTDKDTKKLWDIEKLRAYIAHIKNRFRPTFSPEAAKLLQTHYEQCRLKANDTIHTTVRMFEGLIRLSQAHARLMYRNKVELQDAVAVVLLMECSAYTRGGFNGFREDSEFYVDPMTAQVHEGLHADNPDFYFRTQQRALLSTYDLLHLLSESEIAQVELAGCFLSAKGEKAGLEVGAGFQKDRSQCTQYTDCFGRTQVRIETPGIKNKRNNDFD